MFNVLLFSVFLQLHQILKKLIQTKIKLIFKITLKHFIISTTIIFNTHSCKLYIRSKKYHIPPSVVQLKRGKQKESKTKLELCCNNVILKLSNLWDRLYNKLATKFNF